MPLEIEHKYLIDEEKWSRLIPDSSTRIAQAYIHAEADKSVRVRIRGDQAYLTIKGKGEGIKRLEFEYEIPVDHAETLIQEFCSDVIEKIRHEVHFDGKLWEVDEFLGENKGLWVAEIELDSENESYRRPDWVTEDVTHDTRYLNVQLLKTPYSAWL